MEHDGKGLYLSTEEASPGGLRDLTTGPSHLLGELWVNETPCLKTQGEAGELTQFAESWT